MKIGFDISQIFHPGGVATYTKNLSAKLSKSIDIEMIFFYSSLRQRYKGDLRGVKEFILPPTVFELLFNKFRLPIEYFIGPIDIYHSSDWAQPKTQAKKVTTYHDLIPIKFPNWSSPKIVSVHQRRLKLVESEVDKVIAVSQCTKKDLIEQTKIPGEKIVVIYEGVDPRFKPQQAEDKFQFKQKYRLPDKFLLSIGGIGERRNLKRIKEACKDYNLVITGENIPLLEDDEMPLLYSFASALVYPSLYEGFGLPILEAMACGCPVLTSNTSSMPEVAGTAAVLVNPSEVSEIKIGIKKIIDGDLREEFIKKGLNRAKQFSWERCARETINVYQNLIK